MLLPALVAFIGSLVAFAGVTALLRGWFETRESYLLACAVALLSLSGGLGAATIGLTLEWHPILVRAYLMGVGLLAMLSLALGAVELVTRSGPAAFAVRLLVVSLSIVAGVILAVDPLRESADGGLPSAGGVYLQLPLTLLTAAHAAVVLVVAGCFLAVALRAWRGVDGAGDLFLSCVLVLLAAACLFVVSRPELVSLPPVLSTMLVTGAAVLLWVIPIRALRAEEAAGDDETLSRSPGARDATAGDGGLGDTARSAGPQTVGENEPHRADMPEAGGAGVHDAGGPARDGSALGDACGFIVIFTLREGAARPFDRLAESTVRAIHEKEAGTLLYTCHTVVDAPQQRIFYELYRDREAMQQHEQQPHVRRFVAEREQYVLATNVVRLKLNSHTGAPEPQVHR